mgnify:CR=1 FL=1
MNQLAIKGLGLILVIANLVGIGYLFGSAAATREYLPQLESIKAVIEASDAQAHETQMEQEKNHEEIANKHADNVAAVVGFYDRLLRKAGNQARPSPPTVCPEIPDGTPSQCGTSESDIEFQRACVLDAVTVLSWQEWARSNRFQIK